MQQWAYDAAAPEPQQDFDLHLSGWIRPVFVQLAADIKCPKREYFLNVLHLVTGDVVQAGLEVESVLALRSLVRFAKDCTLSDVLRWAKETENLLASPAEFNFDYWCSEGWRKKI